MDALRALGGVFLAAAVAVAPVAGLALLLNLRDRRRASLLAAVADVVGAPDLRGRVGLEVRCGMLSPGGRLAVHLAASSGEEILALLSRLSRRLSPRVRLSVDSRLGEAPPTGLWVEARRAGPARWTAGGPAVE